MVRSSLVKTNPKKVFLHQKSLVEHYGHLTDRPTNLNGRWVKAFAAALVGIN
jgi:hypothetical protein